MKFITHEEYMAPSVSREESKAKHQAYHLQFATPATQMFIEEQIGLAKLASSKDEHFNDIIKHSRGGAGWVWDYAPVNLTLLRELGGVSKGCRPSPSTVTSIAKSCARAMLAGEFPHD